ncbi:hypothetical protein Tco_0724905 [Tanacetum coccineum]|uniref:Uncharacterized protein n=1 Tax=Tanacetum coccineum TaxID=301880 RepID=A0ABQ4YBE2_9ASTR
MLAVAFMAKLSTTIATTIQKNHIDTDAETEIGGMSNTYRKHQFNLLDNQKPKNFQLEKPKACNRDLAQGPPYVPVTQVTSYGQAAQPVLYDADTLLHPTHHPVSIWDSEEVLVHQVVSMKKMNEKPGHVRPENGFYDKLNALKVFVSSTGMSSLYKAYWLPANERASQTSNPNSPVTPFIHKSRPPSQVLASLRNVNAVFPQFEGIIKERTTQKPDYVSEWCFDYAKQFVEQQLVENVILKRRYDELSKANTHSRTAYTAKLSALTTQHTKLQAQVTGTTSSGPSTSETSKVLAPGMYNLGSKYIPPPKRANWVKPTPLPKKKQVTFSEPPRPSLKPTQKPVVHPNKQTNMCVPMSTGVKPTSGASKTVPKRAPRNHSSLPAKSANARRVEAHHRTLNKKNRVDSNLIVKHSVSISNLSNVCGGCNKSLVFANHNDCLVMCDDSVNNKPLQTKRPKHQPKKESKPIKNVEKPIKRVWKPIRKLVDINLSEGH